MNETEIKVRDCARRRHEENQGKTVNVEDLKAYRQVDLKILTLHDQIHGLEDHRRELEITIMDQVAGETEEIVVEPSETGDDFAQKIDIGEFYVELQLGALHFDDRTLLYCERKRPPEDKVATEPLK